MPGDGLDDILGPASAQAAPTAGSGDGLDDILRPSSGNVSPAAPQKGFLQQAGDFLRPATKAIGGALLPALAQMPSAAIGPLESGLNLYQKWGRSQQDMPGGAPPLSQWLSSAIPAANQAAGTSGPYLDLTGQINRTPWVGGQSPSQLAAQNPPAAFVGNVLGGLPYAFLGGAGEAEQGATLLGQLAKSGATAGAYSGAFGGLEEAGQEVKDNDQLNPGKIAAAGALNAAVGAPLGAAIHGLGAGIGKLVGNYQMGQAIKNVKAERINRQAERAANTQRYITDEEGSNYPGGREYQSPQAREMTGKERADSIYEQKINCFENLKMR